jgi:DNA-binding PadR family transcriptional regulator
MLRYGVLGLLIERRGYGYELVQRLIARLGSAWQLTPSAVYTALDQLEDAFLIEAVPSEAECAPAGDARARRLARCSGRVVYRVTEAGLAEFNAWLARPSARVAPIRSELALKIALASPDTVPPLLAAIAHEERMIVQSLQEQCRLAAGERERSEHTRGVAALWLLDGGGQTRRAGARRPAAVPASGWPATTSALVSAAAATRLQGELDWLQAVRETLQRMLGENIADAGSPDLAGGLTLA